MVPVLDGRLGVSGPTNYLPTTYYTILLGVGSRRVEESDQTHESPSPLLVCARHCDATHAAACVVVDLVRVGLIGLGLGLRVRVRLGARVKGHS